MALKKRVRETQAPVQQETVVEQQPVVEQEPVVEREPVQQETVVEQEPVQQETVVEQQPVVEQEPVGEPVIEREPVQQEVSQRQVAVQDNSKPAPKTAVAVTGSEGLGNITVFQQEAEESGFEGLEVGGFGSFPVMVLNNGGRFECEDEELDETEFNVQPMMSSALYMATFKGSSIDDDVAYTYDQVNLTTELDGCTTVEELKQVWAEEGRELILKKYLEVVVEITSGEYSGEVVMAKIPPASEKAFSTKLFLEKKRTGLPLNEIQLNFSVGSRRKATNGSTYYPWKFSSVDD